MRLLLDCGARVGVGDALRNACELGVAAGYAPIVEALCQHGADTEYRGRGYPFGTPLVLACKPCKQSKRTPDSTAEVVRVLLKYSASVNVLEGNDDDDVDYGPLQWAVWNGNIFIVRLLVDFKGTDLDICDWGQGHSLLEIARKARIEAAARNARGTRSPPRSSARSRTCSWRRAPMTRMRSRRRERTKRGRAMGDACAPEMGGRDEGVAPELEADG